MKAIIFLILIITFNFGCNNTGGEKVNIINDSIVRYKNGKIREIIRTDNNNNFIDSKFMDKNGVLLNETFPNHATKFLTYFYDTSISEISYVTLFKVKGDDGIHMTDDSGYAYGFHYNLLTNPIKAKYLKHKDQFILIEYKGDSIKKDTIAKWKLLRKEIDRIIADDSSVEGYLPDVDD